MSRPERAVLEAVVALGRALRAGGMAVSVDHELTLCRALAEVDVRRREQVYWAARASFVRAPAEVELFDAAFARFWAGMDPAGPPRGAEHGESDPRMPGPQHGGESLPQFRQEQRAGHLLGGQPTRASREVPTAPGAQTGTGNQRGVLAAYSPVEALSERESLGYAPDELAAVRQMAHELRAVAPERRSRRMRASRHGGRLDVRRSLRRSLRTEGEVVEPAWVEPSRRPRRLLLLCDVSGSMERYSRVLLASLQAAVVAGVRAEAFVFATRLTRLTGALRGRDLALALEDARGSVADWSGGTRIGAALAHFNREYARLGLARGAVAVVVSDGWDRGDPDLLARELERLRLQCRRLVWLNPRPGALDGQPHAVGLRAAIPYVDELVAGDDPRARAGLSSLVAGLGRGRPSRPQRPVGFAVR